MRCRSLSQLAVLALCNLGQPAKAAGTQGAPPAVEDDANARVRALFRQAYTAYNARNYEESRQLLLQAWAIRQTYDVASALAQSEMKLQHYREAAAHLQFSLDTFAPSASEQTLEAIKQAHADAKSHVGTLHIASARDGTTIILDGQTVGESPLASPVYCDPGQHEIEFKQNRDFAKKTIDVEAGQDLDVDIPLEHVPPPPEPRVPEGVVAPPGPAPKPLPTPPRDQLRELIIPATIAGAAFAIGVGTAIGFRVAANSKDSQADDLRAKLGANGCAAGTQSTPDCAALLDAAQGKDRDRNWSTAGMVLATMALLAVPVYWYWPGRASKASFAATKLRINGSVGSQYFGVLLSREF